MYLFFDTETVGLPRNWKAPVTDLSNWPRRVQLAYHIYDGNGNKIIEFSHIIRPNGFTIPIEASNIHGITTARALAEGKDLSTVLTEFHGFVKSAEHLVAHNMSFDEKIMGAELLRNGYSNIVQTKNRICTMHSTTNFCRIPGNYGSYKWPKLSELHYKLFNCDFEDAHDASVDIAVTAKCFWELRRLGKI